MPDFRGHNVTVTLKGEEWFAIMAKLLRKELSTEGKLLAARGQTKMAAQVGKASDELLKQADTVRSNVLAILKG